MGKQKLQNRGRILMLRGQTPRLLSLERAQTLKDQTQKLVIQDLKKRLQNLGQLLMLRGQTPRLRSQASALMLQNKNLRVWNKHCFRTGIQVYNNWDRRRYMYFEIASAR